MPSLAKALSSTSLGKLPVWPEMPGAGVGEIFDVMVLVAGVATAIGAAATRRMKKCIVQVAGVSYHVYRMLEGQTGLYSHLPSIL